MSTTTTAITTMFCDGGGGGWKFRRRYRYTARSKSAGITPEIGAAGRRPSATPQRSVTGSTTRPKGITHARNSWPGHRHRKTLAVRRLQHLGTVALGVASRTPEDTRRGGALVRPIFIARLPTPRPEGNLPSWPRHEMRSGWQKPAPQFSSRLINQESPRLPGHHAFPGQADRPTWVFYRRTAPLSYPATGYAHDGVLR